MTHCPLCGLELLICKDAKYNNYFDFYPTYQCTAPHTDPCKSAQHYVKFAEGDWGYFRYQERAVVGNYRVINYTDLRMQNNYSIIEKPKLIKRYFDDQQDGYVFDTVLRLPRPIKLDSNLLDRIKTYLLLS